jgi:2-oxoglutarate ferredoxin oxidoreductase subunit gamma
MNLPSLDKYESTVSAGGKIFIDSTFIERKVDRTDVDAYYIPATKLASEAGVPTLANIVLLGKMIKETGIIDLKGMKELFEKIIPPKRHNLIEANLSTLAIGYNFE